jgi:hypothetical protein
MMLDLNTTLGLLATLLYGVVRIYHVHYEQYYRKLSYMFISRHSTLISMIEDVSQILEQLQRLQLMSDMVGQDRHPWIAKY